MKKCASIIVFFIVLYIQTINSFFHTTTTRNNNIKTRIITRGGKNDNDNAESLLKKAEMLRSEVNKIEQEKAKEREESRVIQQKLETENRNQYLRYSAEVPILKSDGSEVMERVQFLPRLKGKKSKIITIQAALPLGLILGESNEFPGLTTVDEINEGSNAELAGVMVGDLLRACTACQVSMEMPTWQLMAGGIGRPKTSRMMFSTDGKPFEEVMEALVSNKMDPKGRHVWLVLERID